MPLDFTAANNYGLPSSLVDCSPEKEILGTFRQSARTVIWRRPLNPQITNYFDELTASPEGRGRLSALNDLLLTVCFMASGQLRLQYIEEQVGQMAQLNAIHEHLTLSHIFPGNAGRALIEDLEQRSRDARTLFDHPPSLNLLFRTKTQKQGYCFHRDMSPVLGSLYSLYGSEFGRDEDFEPYLDGTQSVPHTYALIDNDRPVYKLQPGDVTIFRCIHREATSKPHDQYRLWAGFYNPKYQFN